MVGTIKVYMDISKKKVQLCVAAFLDGRPGHEKQTMGIIKNLHSFFEMEVREVQVGQSSFLKRLVHHAGFCLPLPLGSGLVLDGVDLLIGTGSSCHPVMAYCRKKFQIPAVICMAPDFFYRNAFDLCFVPVHDAPDEKKNIFATMGAPNCSVNNHRHDKKRGLIVLGGEDRSHYWDSQEITQMVTELVTRDSGVRWTVSSSPRTPDETVVQMVALDNDFDNVSFFDFRDTGRGWIEEQYDLSEYVWVTSDSVSMIYEALSAGCKVGLLPVNWRRVSNKFKKNEDLLLQKHLVVSYREWLQNDISWLEELEMNEAFRCAQQIVKTWWPKNLQ